jgi:hypothetical protein
MSRNPTPTDSSRHLPSETMEPKVDHPSESDQIVTGRPFACSSSGCPKSFSTLYNLNRHFKTAHENPKPPRPVKHHNRHAKHFSRRNNLAVHLYNVHRDHTSTPSLTILDGKVHEVVFRCEDATNEQGIVLRVILRGRSKRKDKD